MSADELLEKKKNEKQATPHTRKEQQMKQLKCCLEDLASGGLLLSGIFNQHVAEFSSSQMS